MNPMIPSPHALQPSALSKLSLRDKLLLAQAVHEIGTSPPDWGRVSALLLAHPLIRQQSRLEQAANAGLTLGRIFGTRECERAWTALMRQRGLVLGKDEVVPEPPASTTPTTPKPKEPRGLQPRTDRRSQLALAQLLYAERLEELKEQIKEKEEQFKTLVKEIDEIKSGKADARLEMELRIEMENLANGPPLPPSTPAAQRRQSPGPQRPDPQPRLRLKAQRQKAEREAKAQLRHQETCQRCHQLQEQALHLTVLQRRPKPRKRRIDAPVSTRLRLHPQSCYQGQHLRSRARLRSLCLFLRRSSRAHQLRQQYRHLRLQRQQNQHQRLRQARQVMRWR